MKPYYGPDVLRAGDAMENTTFAASVIEGDIINKWLLSILKGWELGKAFYQETPSIRLPTIFPASQSHTPEITELSH